MLIFGSRLLNAPVMSLQTGGRLAAVVRPIIDPGTLRVVAYEVDGELLSEKPSFLRTADIREYGRLGMIVNGNDDLVGLDDVIEINKLYGLNFSLVGLQVIDENGRKLGKVTDFTLETDSFFIQQLSVRRGLLKGITDTGLLVNRTQIVEINDTSVVVRSPSVKKAEPVMQSMRTEFVNPFKNARPHPEAMSSPQSSSASE